MKEMYERPMIDEIIFDTEAVMRVDIVNPSGIEEGGEQ